MVVWLCETVVVVAIKAKEDAAPQWLCLIWKMWRSINCRDARGNCSQVGHVDPG